jgi:hypothetical protein
VTWHYLAEGGMPDGAAASSITGLLLGYGPLGLAALVMGYLLFVKRWRFIGPDEEEKIRQEARTEGQAELDRANARADKAEARAERTEAKYDAVVDDFKPLLVSFVSVTGTLNPILQDIVRFGLPAQRNRRREE